jgi:hypothetical protein
LVWFGEIERKLAKLTMPTFTYRSSSELFYGYNAPQTSVDFPRFSSPLDPLKILFSHWLATTRTPTNEMEG